MIEDEHLTYEHFNVTVQHLLSHAEQYKSKMNRRDHLKTASEMYQLLTDLMKA